MGILGDVSSYYDEYMGYDPYTDIYISPEYDPYAGYEFFPSVPEAGYEYYDPAYGISYFPDPAMREPGFFGSLFDAFKEAGKQLLKSPLLPSLIGRDKGNLQESFPRLGITPGYDRMDGQLYTPYPRADTGSRPISVGAMPGGISPTILLIGAGAAVFLILRRKK